MNIPSGSALMSYTAATEFLLPRIHQSSSFKLTNQLTMRCAIKNNEKGLQSGLTSKSRISPFCENIRNKSECFSVRLGLGLRTWTWTEDLDLD